MPLDERVLDSSCGTGGFPVIAMTHVMNKLEKVFVDEFNSQRADWNENIRRQFQERVSDLARNNFFAFDLNPDLVKAAKMNMVMNNDGSGNIWQAITPTFKIPINFEMFQAYTKFLKNIFGFIVDGVILATVR